MLTFLALSIFTIIAEHVPVAQNDSGNASFRPLYFSILSSARILSPELSPLTAYQIPLGLLLHLPCLVSVSQTGDLLESATITLLSLDMIILLNGAK